MSALSVAVEGERRRGGSRREVKEGTLRREPCEGTFLSDPTKFLSVEAIELVDTEGVIP
jgi:hypothetical protein